MPPWPQLEDYSMELGPRPQGPIDPGPLQESAAIFGMLAATARLQIIWLLCDGERDVGTLAGEVGQSVAAVSQHLAKLKLAGIVRARKEGRRHVYLVVDTDVSEIVQIALRHHQRRQHGTSRMRSGTTS
jgi:DNA-binding transcriptional ArsR family regulator